MGSTDRAIAEFDPQTDRRLAWAAVLLTAAFAAGIGPWDRHVVTGALYFLLPQATIVGIALLVCRRGAAAFGSALALALYMGLYAIWVHLQTHPDGLIWLGYFFSLPGAALGSLIAAVIARDHRTRSACFIAALTTSGTAIGIALNQSALCATLIHCRL